MSAFLQKMWEAGFTEIEEYLEYLGHQSAAPDLDDFVLDDEDDMISHSGEFFGSANTGPEQEFDDD